MTLPGFSSSSRSPLNADLAQVRRTLERLGPVFIKIGQHLSLRPDLVSPAVAQELLLLTDRVPPEPSSAIDRMLKKEFGLTRADLSIGPMPIAAGSFAEVFAGRAPDGTKIAVKVQRPNIEERVQRALDRAGAIERVLRLVGIASDVSIADMVAELRESLLGELDFKTELRNLGRMGELAEGSAIMAFPKPYADLSGEQIVTMEFFDGIALSAVLTRVRADGPGEVDRLGVNRTRAAANLVRSALEQIFDFEEFHADMHPGNVILLPGDVIGFVDLGLVGNLSRSFRARLAGYLRAIHDDDVDRMIEGALRLLGRTDRSNPEGFRADFRRAHEAWVRTRNRPGEETSTGPYMIELLRAARRNALVAPREILALYRSLCTAELIAAEIAPSGNLSAVGPLFFREQERKAFFELFDLDALQRDARNAVELVLEGPGRLSQLLADLEDNRFVLQVETVEAPRARARADLRAKLVTVAIVDVALTVLFAGILHTASAWKSYAVAAISLALVGAYAFTTVLWRRLS